MTVWQVLAAAGFLCVAGYLVWMARVIAHIPETLEPAEDRPAPTSGLEDIVHKLAMHDQELARLTLAISDGIQRVDRAEKRVQKSVTGARKLLRENGLEHPALEAEFEELHGEDGDGSETPELQLLPGPVEPDPKTGIPGVSWAQLQEINERMRHA